MKKLEGQQAELLKGIINEGETVFEIDGSRYEILFIPEKDIRTTTVNEDVENDSDLRDILMQAKRDILDRNYKTSVQMREMIRRGEI